MALTRAEYEAKLRELEIELGGAEAEIATDGESVKYRPISEIRSSIRYFENQLRKLDDADANRGRHRAFRVRGCRGL